MSDLWHHPTGHPGLVLIAHAYWWQHLPDGTCYRLLQKHPSLYADISDLQIAGVFNRDRYYFPGN